MAASSYTTNLTEIDNVQAIGTWDESSDAGWDDGSGPVAETDYYINGSACISQQCTKTGIATSIVDYGSDAALATGEVFLIWIVMANAANLDVLANGGIRAMIGSGLGAFDSWDVGGSDYSPNPYGGWQNVVVDPTVTPDDTVGTPVSHQFFGAALSMLTASSRGYPFGVGISYFGRADAVFTGGQAADYCTFAGYAAVNDGQSARYGLIQAVAGGYLWKGLMTLGITATLVDMRDSNVAISIADTRKVTASFNRIEVSNASSNIAWTNVNITALGTVSRGEFEMIDNATVLFTACVFTDMSTWIFQSNATLIGSTWRRCGVITHGGADFEACIFEGYEGTADTAYLIYGETTDIDTKIANSSFTMGTALTHAISFTDNTTVEHTLTGVSFTGYHATNGNTSSALYFPDSGSDIAWVINLVGCSGDISYKKVRAGDTVTFVIDPVTLTFTVTDEVSGLAIQFARINIVNATTFVELYQIETNASGIATQAHTFAGDLGIEGWCRQFDIAGEDYASKDWAGTIKSTGFDIAIVLARI